MWTNPRECNVRHKGKLLDVPIQTGQVLEHNRPDIVIVVPTMHQICCKVDVLYSFDSRIVKKEENP